jgi:predicted porin
MRGIFLAAALAASPAAAQTAIEVLAEAQAAFEACERQPSMVHVANLQALALTVPLVATDPGSRVAEAQARFAAQMVEWCRGYVEGS